MLKFVHIGDVHLDTHFYSKKPELRKLLRESLRNSFRGVINFCIKERVNALLIAGDLFDNHQLSFQTEKFMLHEFSRLKEANIKVFYATGNHDPGYGDNRINTIHWPDNVIVFRDDEVQSIDILNSVQEPMARIIGVGHRNNREGRNLIHYFPEKKDRFPHIGLAHAMVTNAKSIDAHDRYLPCSKEDLEEKGYDYWALGHIHQYQKISQEHAIYYSGNLQGRNPKETGLKGGLMVTIDAHNGIKTEFIQFSSVVFETVEVKDLMELENYEQLKERLIQSVAADLNDLPYQNERLFLRIELLGRCPLKEELQKNENIQQLEEDLLYHFGFMEVEVKTDQLLSPLPMVDFSNGNHVLGRAMGLIDEAVIDEELLSSLINLPFANPKIKTIEEKKNYVRKLLTGLQEEAVERMVGEKHAY